VTRPAIEVITGAEGAPLAVYDFGGTGTPTLFVHATGFCAEVWGPMIRAAQGVRAMALDVRCHGRSQRVPHDRLSWDLVANDVQAAVDHFGLHGAIGVGHSMGGALLLLTEAAAPGTFAAIWAYEPIVIPPHFVGGDGDNPLSQAAAHRRARFDSRHAALENFASKPPMDSFSREALEGYLDGGFETAADGSISLRCLPEDEAYFYRMGGLHSGWEALPRVAAPTAVVRGAETVPGPASFAPLVADRLPRGRLVEHPELGHFGPMEDPEAMAADLHRFVETSLGA
jgi:pimeloyl-ACP methyl ester carboxylesterase